MPEQMPAVVHYAPNPDSVELRSLPIPTIGKNDVLLETRAVGVCGSDIHQWKGSQSWKVNFPVILGHEFSGEIVATGADVRSFRVGDRVVSETAAVINASSPLSRQGDYHLDPDRLGFGYGVDGAMARYTRVPERCLHRIPDSLPFEIAALTEPCCVAYNAICVNSSIRPGDSVAILGPGPIGLLCLSMALLSGAEQTIVIGASSDEDRLKTARAMGASQSLLHNNESLDQTVQASGDGLGFDLVVDAAGVSQSLMTAMSIVRPGGQITKVGWGPQPLGFSLDPIVQKGVTLRGSFSHNWPVWEKVIGLLASGKLSLEGVLNRTAPLEEWSSVFQAMLDKSIVKGVLLPHS